MESRVGFVHQWVDRVCGGVGGALLGQAGHDGWLSTGLPFSFRYGDRDSADLLSTWTRRVDVQAHSDGRTTHTVTHVDPESALEVSWQATTYVDHPAVEWIVFFRNAGRDESPVLSAVKAMDLVAATDYHELVVYHARGGIAAPDAFEPRQTVLDRTGIPRFGGGSQPEPFRLGSVGGRSSNGDLPYFNVEASWGGYRGLVVAVGWSGQWQAEITRFGHEPARAVEPDHRTANAQISRLRNATRLRVQVGMEDTHLALQPGEQIRTPRIVLIPWEEDRLSGQNALRQFIHRRVSPKLDGAPPPPSIWCNVGIVEPNAYLLGVGETHLSAVAKFAALGVDYFIIDAGWYEIPPARDPAQPATWSQGVGNYRVRRDVFPDGLRPVADEVRKHGMKFGLWFEPERVCEGTEVFRDHRDWLFPEPVHRGFIFNLGIPDARKWLTDRISQLIEELGIVWFRHDANANYLPAWRSADDPRRRGISEIRYVEGLYEFWGELLTRHPGLIVEGCASGGRRMDIEALRYHHSYWYTDWMVGDPTAMQSHVYGASLWLPPNYCNNVMSSPSAPTRNTTERRYGFFSALGGAVVVGWRWLNEKEPLDLDLGRRWLAQFRALRHLTTGDFFPLLPHTLSEGQWLASQYHRADLDEGLILAFRRRFCPASRVILTPRALDPTTRYEVVALEGGDRTVQEGSALARGIEVALDDAPAHQVLHYRRVG